MNLKKILFYVLMFLPVLMCLVALPILPEQIPAHYNGSGQVDRWGSRYEILLFPAATILMGLFMLGMAKLSAKAERDGSNNENICILGGCFSLLLFNAMTVYFLYTDLCKVEDLSSVSVEISQLAFALLGVALIVIGNFMPKVRMNSVSGLRTPWSMKNETTWKKSQRFGGISFILAGLLILLVCFLTKGLACILWSLGILLVTTIVDVVYTYDIAKRY